MKKEKRSHYLWNYWGCDCNWRSSNVKIFEVAKHNHNHIFIFT